MLKFIVLTGFFLLFTFFIWSFGLGPTDGEPILQYLVFATQLLYGNVCYDVSKSLRQVPNDNKFWNASLAVAGEAAVCMIISIGASVVAFKVNFLAYTGLVVAAICYGYLFANVLPKLHPLYKEAMNNASTSH